MIGNCYTFALARYRRQGGWLVLRRSVKSWVPHMQWGASALERADEVAATLEICQSELRQCAGLR